ncbi:SH3 domain-containing protein, partial [Sansalvadorimonas sp. 2012CJ34-2]
MKQTSLEKLMSIIDSPTMRAIQTIENSPAMRAANLAYSSPVLQAIDQIENSTVARALRDIESPTLQALQRIESLTVSSAIQQALDSPALRAIKYLDKSQPFIALTQIIEDLSRYYGPLTFEKAFEEVLEANELFDINNNSFDEIAKDIGEREETSPRHQLSAEFYLGCILTLVLAYVAYFQGVETEQNILNKISSLETTINRSIETIDQSKNNNHFYVTKSSLNLRSGPGIEHEIVSVLPKNNRLNFLITKGEWMKVEFFDYINNNLLIGWVHSQ